MTRIQSFFACCQSLSMNFPRTEARTQGARLVRWTVASLLLVTSVGYGQANQSVTVEIVLSQTEKPAGPSRAKIAKAVLSALGADTSLEMANIGLQADEALNTGPEPREMAIALIKIVSPSKIMRTEAISNRIRLRPVDDFDAFCDAIDYARILEKNRSRRYVKIRIKRGELTMENLVERARQAGREELLYGLAGQTGRTGLERGRRFPRLPSGMSRFGGMGFGADDEPEFKIGDAVEVEIGGKLYQAVVKKSDSFFGNIVELTDMEAIAKYLSDRAMQRAVTSLDSLRIIAPSEFLRASRKLPGPARKTRVWKDKSGRFEVEATYVSHTGDAVKIQKKDGSIVTVPLAKFSQADRDYLNSLSKQPEGSSPSAPLPVIIRELAVDRSGVRLIQLADVQPSPPPPAAPIMPDNFSAAAKAIAITKGDTDLNSVEVLSRLEAAANGVQGLALWNAEKLSNAKQQLLPFDATQSELPARITLPASQHVFDIEPDRGLVMVGTKKGPFLSTRRLSISRIEVDKITPILEWSPYREAAIDGSKLRSAEVEAAWFLSGARVLTKSAIGRLWTIWRLTKQKAIAEVDFVTKHVGTSTAWIRRDGKAVAVVTDGKISLLDVSKGQVTRQINVTGDDYDALKFSDDGRTLAAARRGELRTWDLRSGEIDRELWHPAIGRVKRIDWVGSNLLLDGKSLFNMRHSVLLWEYGGGAYGMAYDNGKLWCIDGNVGFGPDKMIATSIPHPEALQYLDRLQNDASLVVAQSGDEIGLRVNVPNTHADRAEVMAIASERLRTAGYRLADNQNPQLMMVVTATPQPAQEIEVYEQGEWHLYGKEPYIRTFTPHLWSCEFQLDGETIWRQAVNWGPGVVIQMQANDTPESAVARAHIAQVARVIPARIPKRVARPGTATKSGAYGFSRVTADGLQGQGG
ncbi:MAG: SHD1 domain-containing protein [Planctomycetota bacterium]